MRKQTHPQRTETIIRLKDGSTYTKRWVYLKPKLTIELDLLSSPRWKEILLLSTKRRNKITK